MTTMTTTISRVMGVSIRFGVLKELPRTFEVIVGNNDGQVYRVDMLAAHEMPMNLTVYHLGRMGDYCTEVNIPLPLPPNVFVAPEDEPFPPRPVSTYVSVPVKTYAWSDGVIIRAAHHQATHTWAVID